ncbi:GAF domain-containing SpoIIE family protein phosphatase [Streptomyces tsukubensis]|nr:SpoIIE family protein phosphatase [Streptomyces tsukubensis]QFR97447.1 SpoIIE family protein phosphatase [Streptomyces tsukubensis]
MDRFARLVARFLHVPVALVSLLEADRQVFPGMVGLDEPWAGWRQTPLSHSFCQHVVADGEPLVLTDSRRDPRTRSSEAVSELRVIAYAGMPLTDADGQPVGSLCAIDHQPREWSKDELHDLADLTAACSVELRLRIATEQLRRDRDSADLLLRASVELAPSHDLPEVVRRLRRLFDGSPSQPSYVGLLLADGPWLRRVVDPDHVSPVETTRDRVGVDDHFPSARAMREQRTVFVPDRAALVADYSQESVAGYDSLGLAATLCVPLARRSGVLAWCWAGPHVMAVTERAILTAVAEYVSQAVERTRFVESRLGAAEQLQAAMLTELPTVPGLEMAALYLPAADQDMVGGDWYDAYLLPPAPAGPPLALMVSVGDITGHDMRAATVMGQVRSMLRQATLGHPAHSPAAAVTAVDNTFAVLPLGDGGTLVHARLTPHGDRWKLTWSNAGHPPPLLRTPEGRVTVLHEHDLLLGAPSSLPRHDHERELPAGSVLLLYTDGLVERRDTDIDTSIARTVSTLSEHGESSLPLLLEALSEGLENFQKRDDVAVLALRIGPLVSAPAMPSAR